MSNKFLFHPVPELPTCLLCVCLTGSVYCEEVDPDMTSVPALPKETAYLYARYNKIKKITAKDFGDIGAFLPPLFLCVYKCISFNNPSTGNGNMKV